MENKTAGHTPGPWHTEDVTFYSPIAKDKEWVEIWTHGPDGGKQNIVALSGYGEEGFELKTQKANARLIAAAPELAERLEEMVNMFEGLARVTLRDRYTQSAQEKAARDTLAKAKGRE